MMNCPCGTGVTYQECCGPYHRAVRAAPTAEALMRSRFSAYARRDADYVRRSWHPSTRPRTLELPADLRWVRLEILDRTNGGLFDTDGTVRFDAHYLDGDQPGVLREDSRFTRERGEWRYVGPRPSAQSGGLELRS
jgi:SEC-C motif-containing protein